MDSFYPKRCPECRSGVAQLTFEDGDASHFRCESCAHEWSVEFDPM